MSTARAAALGDIGTGTGTGSSHSGIGIGIGSGGGATGSGHHLQRVGSGHSHGASSGRGESGGGSGHGPRSLSRGTRASQRSIGTLYGPILDAEADAYADAGDLSSGLGDEEDARLYDSADLDVDDDVSLRSGLASRSRGASGAFDADGTGSGGALALAEDAVMRSAAGSRASTAGGSRPASAGSGVRQQPAPARAGAQGSAGPSQAAHYAMHTQAGMDHDNDDEVL